MNDRSSFLHPVRKRVRHALARVGIACMLLGANAGLVRAEGPSGKPVDGIRCEQAEGAVVHIHQHLTILDHGAAVPIPSDVGRPLFVPCLYWLHTHANDGLIHVESPVVRTFTLGNFFDVWGEPLSATRVGALRLPPGRLRVYVNGVQYRGNPRAIELTDHADITFAVGAPYRKPAPFTAWNGE